MNEKMMNPDIIDYYMFNCTIPSIITIKNCYQIDFSKPVHDNIKNIPISKYFDNLTMLLTQFYG